MSFNGHINCKHKGKSNSFWMHDPKVIFNELNLKEGNIFLDLGCGKGEYSIYAAKIGGDSGLVYALDRKTELITSLNPENAFANFRHTL